MAQILILGDFTTLATNAINKDIFTYLRLGLALQMAGPNFAFILALCWPLSGDTSNFHVPTGSFHNQSMISHGHLTDRYMRYYFKRANGGNVPVVYIPRAAPTTDRATDIPMPTLAHI